MTNLEKYLNKLKCDNCPVIENCLHDEYYSINNGDCAERFLKWAMLEVVEENKSEVFN